MNLTSIVGRDQMVSVGKSRDRGPRATEIVVEYRRAGGIERHVGRFDEARSSVVADLYYQAVRAGASRIMQSVNDFRIEPASQNRILWNRLVAGNFARLTDRDVVLWENFVVGVRRRRKADDDARPTEVEAVNRLAGRVIKELSRHQCRVDVVVEHRHGSRELVFRFLDGELSSARIDRLLDGVQRRCREAHAVVDTSRRNASAMIQLPTRGRIYFAIDAVPSVTLF